MADFPYSGIESALRAALAGGESVYLLCYLPFGIVRGLLVTADENASAPRPDPRDEMLELSDAVVEHYSNHLPTAHYRRIHLRLTDISGCVVLGD